MVTAVHMSRPPIYTCSLDNQYKLVCFTYRNIQLRSRTAVSYGTIYPRAAALQQIKSAKSSSPATDLHQTL